MEFDERVGGRTGARVRAPVTDAVEFIAHDSAVDPDDVERLLEAHATHVDEAAEHVRREAGALLVGEEGDGERVLGLDATLGQRLEHLEAREDAEVAVVATARAHRVDVAAGHHRWGVGAAGPHGDHVADAVHGDVEAEVVHPRDDQVAAVAVFVGERQATRPAAADGADRRQVRDAPEEAVAVDAEVLVGHLTLRRVRCRSVGPARG